MRYKTKDIGEAGIDVQVAVTEAWLAAECGGASLGLTRAGLCLSGRLEPAGEGYLLRGSLRGELLAPCARCLEPALVTVEAPIAASFVVTSASAGNDPDEAQDDAIPIEHGTIDLGRPIRDEILLAIPMSPVCRPDCAGICPACGRNRNLTPCDCGSRTPAGSKLGVLAKMKLQ
jgi:uncharacterized protein